jgi:hypothetical protein
VIVSCILISRQELRSAGIYCILSYTLPFKNILRPRALSAGPRLLQARNQLNEPIYTTAPHSALHRPLAALIGIGSSNVYRKMYPIRNMSFFFSPQLVFCQSFSPVGAQIFSGNQEARMRTECPSLDAYLVETASINFCAICSDFSLFTVPVSITCCRKLCHLSIHKILSRWSEWRGRGCALEMLRSVWKFFWEYTADETYAQTRG